MNIKTNITHQSSQTITQITKRYFSYQLFVIGAVMTKACGGGGGGSSAILINGGAPIATAADRIVVSVTTGTVLTDETGDDTYLINYISGSGTIKLEVIDDEGDASGYDTVLIQGYSGGAFYPRFTGSDIITMLPGGSYTDIEFTFKTLDIFERFVFDVGVDVDGNVDDSVDGDGLINGSDFVWLLGNRNVNNVIEGTGVRDYIRGGTGADTINGGTGDDTIDGGAGIDEIYGGDGNDILNGGAGNDYIEGGAGIDRIEGGAGNDQIHGGAGNDELYGGGGNDTIDGGDGDDIIVGSAGNDEIYGGAENDYIEGGDGVDTIYGGDGDDTILGGAENDYIEGGDGVDTINGGDGNDTIYGGAGNDYIVGGADDDIVDGGEGDDTLYGGTGDNKIVYNKGDGNDTITAEDGEDVLILVGFDEGDIENLVQTGDDLTLNFNDGGSIIIKDSINLDAAGVDKIVFDTDSNGEDTTDIIWEDHQFADYILLYPA